MQTTASVAGRADAQTAPGARGTIVADEIDRFSRMAEAWWDPTGDFRPLHQLGPLRVRYIVEHVAKHFGRDPDAVRPLDGLALLDIGCGGGLVAEPMAERGAEVTGIDASDEAVRVARLHAQGRGLVIDYRCAAPEDIGGEGQRFDVLLAMEVVEHVADLGQFIAACDRLLRPGGAIVLATISRTPKSLLLAKIGAEYVLRWLPVGTHDWRKFVRPSELAAGLRRHGLVLCDLDGAAYDPLRGLWSPSRDLRVNYFAFAKKPAG